MTSIAWTYPSIIESEDRMLTDLAAFLKKSDVDPESAQAIMLAVSEAFTNAIIHGNDIQASKEVRVTFDVNDLRITADILDEGIGGLERIANRPEAGALAENGRGIGLIEHYASETVFSSLKSGGLKVSLIFDRSNSSVNQSSANHSDGGDGGNINERKRKCRYSEPERSA